MRLHELSTRATLARGSASKLFLVCEAGRPFVLKATFLWRHDVLDREVAAGQSTAAQRAEREINLLGELRDAGSFVVQAMGWLAPPATCAVCVLLEWLPARERTLAVRPPSWDL